MSKQLMNLTPDDKNWGLGVHIAALLGLLLPFGLVLGPLLIWLLKRHESEFVMQEGKTAINFQLTALLGIVLFIIIRPLIIFAVMIGIAAVVLAVINGLKAKEGHTTQYPISLTLIK